MHLIKSAEFGLRNVLCVCNWDGDIIMHLCIVIAGH